MSATTFDTAEKFGFVLLQSYAGLTKKRVQIIASTAKSYRIRALDDTKLAGRYRWLKAGDEALVQKHAVVLERL